jgi:hypothetical protein
LGSGCPSLTAVKVTPEERTQMKELEPRRPTMAFEQLPRESSKAFAAFQVYLELGPQRSLALVSQRLAKSLPTLKDWSAKFGWPSRVAAHAGYLASVERAAQEAQLRAKADEWLRRQIDLKEREWEMHEKCIAAARRALTAFMERDKVYANLADIARILEVASKLGRMSSGLATETVEHTGADGGPIRVELTAALNKIYGEPLPGEVVDVEATPVPPSQLPEKTK